MVAELVAVARPLGVRRPVLYAVRFAVRFYVVAFSFAKKVTTRGFFTIHVFTIRKNKLAR